MQLTHLCNKMRPRQLLRNYRAGSFTSFLRVQNSNPPLLFASTWSRFLATPRNARSRPLTRQATSPVIPGQALTTLTMPPNPFLLAADNPAALLPLLRETPALASQQDDHGYSLLHAAASYNHLDLLRALVNEFHVPVDLRDEDSETALFVVETTDAARVLVEELGLDVNITGDEGSTAREKIEADGDFPEVAEYLRTKEASSSSSQVNGDGPGAAQQTVNGEINGELPPVPQGLSVDFGTMTEEEVAGALPNPEFRRRIEELAAREDFNTEAGQAALRRLVEEAIAGEDLAEERNVRPREG